MTEFRPYEDRSKPGRLDRDGQMWWACDPYPHWYRIDVDLFGTETIIERGYSAQAWPGEHQRGTWNGEWISPGDYYNVKEDMKCTRCETLVKPQWSGIACDCGGSWYCL